MSQHHQNKPAPAQDDLAAFQLWRMARGWDDPITPLEVWNAALRYATTCPAQTEQQPVEVMRFQLKHPDTGDTRSVTLTRSEVADCMEDTIFEKLGDLICDCQPVGETNVVDCSCDDYIYEFELVNAAPIAQTAPQPEQSGLVEALEAIVRQYPNPDISHVDYRVHACRQAEQALDAYRAALPNHRGGA